MSALISLWVATTQFLKATFTPKSPVFFTFNGSRIQKVHRYITTDVTASSQMHQDASSGISMSEQSVETQHLFSLER